MSPRCARARWAAGALAAAAALSGCAGGGAPSGGAASAPAPRPLPERAAFDYQITDPYPPAEGVEVVIRDRAAEPAPGLYSICYVNAFQVQPAEVDAWRADRPDLLLRDGAGDLVVDEEWDEPLIDVSTPDLRAAAAEVVAPWIRGCADAGFDGVELDNLTSYGHSAGLLTPEDALAYAGLLVDTAHAAGLTVGQKNGVEIVAEGAAAGFDFAVTEDCARWDECAPYADAYPGRVLDVEYRAEDLPAACAFEEAGVSVVLRDLEVAAPGAPGHAYGTCAGLG
jgi:hypothetical protein